MICGNVAIQKLAFLDQVDREEVPGNLCRILGRGNQSPGDKCLCVTVARLRKYGKADLPVQSGSDGLDKPWMGQGLSQSFPFNELL